MVRPTFLALVLIRCLSSRLAIRWFLLPLAPRGGGTSFPSQPPWTAIFTLQVPVSEFLPRADGITFTISRDPRGIAAIGGRGDAMGVGPASGSDIIAGARPIQPSLSVYFDDFADTGAGVGAQHVGMLRNGNTDTSARLHDTNINSAAPFADGGDWEINVTYIPLVPGVSWPSFAVTLTPGEGAGGSQTSFTWLTPNAVPLETLLGGDTAWLGFTACEL